MPAGKFSLCGCVQYEYYENLYGEIRSIEGRNMPSFLARAVNATLIIYRDDEDGDVTSHFSTYAHILGRIPPKRIHNV